MTQEQHTEERQRRGVSRKYENGAIRVKWEPELCIHSGMCWRNLPSVFRPRQAPWVVLEGAMAVDVARTILQCPSGALSFERLDGGPAEVPSEETSIEATPDGPLYVRGRLKILDSRGNVIRDTTRAALCRCGFSANKPFCDLSHLRVRFKAE